MRVLIIGPYSPPVTGNSLAVDILDRYLSEKYIVEKVNLSKSIVSKERIFSRAYNLLFVFKDIFFKHRQADSIYLTIAESKLGICRDLFIYIICWKSLSKMVIHLHGGEGMRNFFIKSGNNWIKKLINYILPKLAGVIILGEHHRDLFSNVISSEKIFVVPNFAEDYIFTNSINIKRKFSFQFPIQVSFISNMIPSKGYMDLLDAYILLPDDIKCKISLNFAGSFTSADNELVFKEKIANLSGVKYYGIVTGLDKKNLFNDSHIFCLPTYYESEGQPITILEAYASGCYVLTTNHSGIGDIFENTTNGEFVEKKSPVLLSMKLVKIVQNVNILEGIANNNYNSARNKYRAKYFLDRLESIICKES